MTKLVRTSLIALALAGGPLAAQSAPPGGFRLPAPTPTPTDIQGPVDPDAPILTRPRDTAPTPTPTQAPRPAPAPTPAAPPRPAVTATPPPVASPTTNPLPPRFTPPAAPAAPAADASSVPNRGASALEAVPAGAGTPPAAPPPVGASAVPAAPADEQGVPAWLYALAGLVLAAAVGGALLWRRREAAEPAPSRIEPPWPAPTPAMPLAGAPPLAATGPQLAIEARALRLSRSMVYATLGYEVLVTNRGGQPLTGVRLGADLVTAHARIPAEQQLADPLVPLAPVRSIDRLDPGESVTVSGELRLPVAQIRPIAHGKAVVYVPLLRVRGEARGLAPVARTFVVGVPAGMNQRLQPFRLDEMPQTYRSVSQHALD